MSDKQITKEELLEKLEAARIKFQNFSLPPELYEVLTEGIAFAEKHFVELQDEKVDLKRQLAEAQKHLEHAYSFMTIEVSGKMELYDPHCDECAAVKEYVEATIAAEPSPSQSQQQEQ